MAIERQDASTTITPSAPIAQTGSEATTRLAGAESQAATESAAMFGQMGQIGTQVLRDQALQQAKEDAAGIAKYDDAGNLIKVKDFSPASLGGMVYNETYANAAREQYRSALVTDAQRHSQQLLLKHPNDPAAVSAGMKAYTQTSIEGMSATDAGTLIPHLEAVRGAATQNAAAELQRGQNLAMVHQSNVQLDTIINESVKTGLALAREKFSDADKAGSEARIADGWKMYEGMAKQLNISPAQIEESRKLVGILVPTKIIADGFYNQIVAAGVDSGMAVADIEAKARTYIDAHPGYTAEIDAVFRDAVQRGRAVAAKAQLIEQRVVEAQKAIQDNNQTEIARMRRDLPPGPESDRLIQAKIAEQQNGQQSALNASGLRAPLKAALALNNMNTSEATRLSVMATSVSRQTAVIDNPQTPPPVKAQALLDLKNLTEDRGFAQMAASSPQGQSIAHRAAYSLGAAYVASHTLDGAAFSSAATSGLIEPATMPAVQQELERKGLLGSGNLPGQMSYGAFQQAVAHNTQLWNQRQTEKRSSKEITQSWQGIGSAGADGVATATQPQITTPAAAARYTAQNPFVLRDGAMNAVPFAPESNPAHLSAALSYHRESGVVPPAVAQYVTDAEKSTDPRVRQSAVVIRQNIENDLRGTTKGLPQGVQAEFVAAGLTDRLGRGVQITDAIAKLGYEATPTSIANEITRTTTPKGQQGTPPNQFDQHFDAVLKSGDAVQRQNAWPTQFENWGKGIYSSIAETLKPGSSVNMFGTGPDGEASMKKAFEGIPVTNPANLLEKAGEFVSLTDIPPFSVHPDAKAMLIEKAKAYVDANWHALSDRGVNVYRVGLIHAINDLKGQGVLSLYPKKDGSGNVVTRELRLHDFTQTLSKAAGVAMSAESAIDFATVQAQNNFPQYFAGTPGMSVQPGSVAVSTSFGGDGRPYYSMTGILNDGKNTLVSLGGIDPHGKDSKAGLQALFQTVAAEVKDSNVMRVLNMVPGGSMLMGVVEKDIREGILRVSNTKNVGSKEVAGLIQDLRGLANRAAYHALGNPTDRTGKEIFTDQDKRDDATWKALETPKYQKSLLENGFFWTLLVNQDTGRAMPMKNATQSPVDNAPTMPDGASFSERNAAAGSAPSLVGAAQAKKAAARAAIPPEPVDGAGRIVDRANAALGDAVRGAVSDANNRNFPQDQLAPGPISPADAYLQNRKKPKGTP